MQATHTIMLLTNYLGTLQLNSYMDIDPIIYKYMLYIVYSRIVLGYRETRNTFTLVSIALNEHTKVDLIQENR